MRLIFAFAALSGLLAVGLGAWAAHGLADRLDAAALAWVRTGLDYQMWHAVALLVLVVLHRTGPGRLLEAAALAFVAGSLLFCGSLYAMAFTGSRATALLTPVGGAAFLAGWALLLLHAATARRDD